MPGTVEPRLSAILERAYQLSADVVRGGRDAAEAERLFDALFKVL